VVITQHHATKNTDTYIQKCNIEKFSVKIVSTGIGMYLHECYHCICKPLRCEIQRTQNCVE